MKKSTLLFVTVMFLALSACKQESAASKLDPTTASVPPASPDAVVAPEANIAAAPDKPAVTVAPPADGKYPVMTFDKAEHDFGKIGEKQQVSYDFKFSNTGEADLIITSAKGSCGCTVPEYPKDPIKPGESGEIKVSFNPSGKKGQQHKTVTILTNTAAGQEKLGVKASIQDAGATK